MLQICNGNLPGQPGEGYVKLGPVTELYKLHNSL